MQEGRDFWWDEEAEKVQTYCPCEPVNSEDPLFILYVRLFFDPSLPCRLDFESLSFISLVLSFTLPPCRLLVRGPTVTPPPPSAYQRPCPPVLCSLFRPLDLPVNLKELSIPPQDTSWEHSCR